MTKPRSQALVEFLLANGLRFNTSEQEVLTLVDLGLKHTKSFPEDTERDFVGMLNAAITHATQPKSSAWEERRSKEEAFARSVKKRRKHPRAEFFFAKGVFQAQPSSAAVQLSSGLYYSDFFIEISSENNREVPHSFSTFKQIRTVAQSEADLLDWLEAFLEVKGRVYWIQGTHQFELYHYTSAGEFVRLASSDEARFTRLVNSRMTII